MKAIKKKKSNVLQEREPETGEDIYKENNKLKKKGILEKVY